MTESVVLFLAAAGGYAFTRNFKVTRLSVLKSSGYALFFRAVLWGYVFFHAACLLLLIIRLEPYWQSVLSYWLHPLENEFYRYGITVFFDSIEHYKNNLAVPSIMALWFGLFLSFPANWIFSSKALHFRIALASGSELESILASALGNRQMLLITLDSKKVYAGWVIRTPRLDVSNQDPGTGFELLVYKSGYRHSDIHKVIFTTDYSWLLDASHTKSGDKSYTVDALSTFIPLHRVVTITNFDRDLYLKFQRDSETVEGNSIMSQSTQAVMRRFRRHSRMRNGVLR